MGFFFFFGQSSMMQKTGRGSCHRFDIACTFVAHRSLLSVHCAAGNGGGCYWFHIASLHICSTWDSFSFHPASTPRAIYLRGGGSCHGFANVAHFLVHGTSSYCVKFPGN